MKKTLVTIINLYVFVCCFCQDYRKIDSLRQLLLSSGNDTTKGLAILNLAWEYKFTVPDTCLYYTNMGLELVKDHSIKAGFERSENPALYHFETNMTSHKT